MDVILSTAYLPPLEYFYYLLQGENAYIEQYEYFIKQTYRNRCHIYGANGLLALSIPIQGRKNKTLTKDIKLSYHYNWQIQHWKTIESAYGSSPFFIYYADCLHFFYQKKYTFLIDMNTSLLEEVMRIFKIKVNLFNTTAYEKNYANKLDIRNIISPKVIPISKMKFPSYVQVFGNKHGFFPNLSIIDALFNLGPETKNYLQHISLN